LAERLCLALRVAVLGHSGPRPSAPPLRQTVSPANGSHPNAALDPALRSRLAPAAFTALIAALASGLQGVFLAIALAAVAGLALALLFPAGLPRPQRAGALGETSVATAAPASPRANPGGAGKARGGGGML
jgi:hypothetical protein